MTAAARPVVPVADVMVAGVLFPAAVAHQLLRRPQRRLIHVGRQLWYVELTPYGITFRQYRHKFTMTVPWRDVLARAERIAGEQLHQEALRAAAARRIQREHRRRIR